MGAEPGADLQRALSGRRGPQRIAVVEALDETALLGQVLQPAGHERVADALLLFGERLEPLGPDAGAANVGRSRHARKRKGPAREDARHSIGSLPTTPDARVPQLYVALTRPTRTLVVVHTRSLPPPLAPGRTA